MELIVSGMDKFQATKNYEASAQFIKAAMVRRCITTVTAPHSNV